VNGIIRASVPDGAGGFYIGGDFTRVGGVARNHIARILSNGTLDPTWNPNANGSVRALAVSGTTVYVGGAFTSIGGQIRSRIARILSNGTVDLTWNPGANGDVLALAVSDTTIYAGGLFNFIGGQTQGAVSQPLTSLRVTSPSGIRTRSAPSSPSRSRATLFT